MISQTKSGNSSHKSYSGGGQLPVRIVVFGVGGGGGNAVNTMLKNDSTGVEFVVANTDIQALEGNNAKIKIQLGKELTRGFGAGTDPEVGRKAAEESVNEIEKVMEGADLVFITLGMGGGTGTGASPVIARLAREVGALTVAVVTRPFSFEGDLRNEIAHEGIRNLKSCVDAIVAISNERILEVAPSDGDIGNAYALGDQVLCDSVQGIFEVITKRGYINCDFADLRTVLNNKGTALLGRGTASGPNCVVEAARRALSSPLLDEINVREATHLLFNITSPSNLSVKDFSVGTQVIKEEFDCTRTKIVFGHVIDDSLAESGSVHVTAIATGFPSEDEENLIEETLQYAPRSEVTQGVSAVKSLRGSHGRRGVPRSTGQHVASYPHETGSFSRDTYEREPAFAREMERPYSQQEEPQHSRQQHLRSLRHSYPAVPATSEEPPERYPAEQTRGASTTDSSRFLRKKSAAPSEPSTPVNTAKPSNEARSILEERGGGGYDLPHFFRSRSGSRRNTRQEDDN